jgi:ubiquinone/menaquinone biosynthesis C-methylase UbiE
MRFSRSMNNTPLESRQTPSPQVQTKAARPRPVERSPSRPSPAGKPDPAGGRPTGSSPRPTPLSEERVVSRAAVHSSQISRVTRSKEQARDAYNRISGLYDLLAGSSERKFIDAGLEMLDVKEGEAVLDIGFGTGYATLALARSVGDSGRVYGIDISEAMAERTRARLRKAGLEQRVRLRRGDAASLPFQSDLCDAIFISFTLELFDTPEIPVVLRECQRVLHRDGRMCVVAMSKRGKENLMVRLYEWAHRKIPTYMDCRPIFVQQSLEDSGFHLVDVSETSMWGLPVDIVLVKPPEFDQASSREP